MLNLKPKTVVKTKLKLEARKDEFKSLSKAEKKVAIAEDVIKQLNDGKIVADHTYFNFQDDAAADSAKCLGEQPSKVNMAELTRNTTCEVCGIGSLFISAMEFDGKYKLGKRTGKTAYPDRQDIIEYLEPYFDKEELNRVEAYFERDHTWLQPGGRGSYWDSDGGVPAKFEEHINHPIWQEDDDKKRLKMIMKNIIKNKGKFIPIDSKKDKQ